MKNPGEAAVLQRVIIGEIGVAEASALLGYTVRTVYRRVKRLRDRGEGGLVHGLTGRPSNRAKDPDVRRRTISLFRALGEEQSLAKFRAVLEREEGISICRESLRRWLLSEGFWEPNRRAKGAEAAPRGVSVPAFEDA